MKLFDVQNFILFLILFVTILITSLQANQNTNIESSMSPKNEETSFVKTSEFSETNSVKDYTTNFNDGKYRVCLSSEQCSSTMYSYCHSNICLKPCKLICSLSEYCNTSIQLCIPNILRPLNSCRGNNNCQVNEICSNGNCVKRKRMSTLTCAVDDDCLPNETCRSSFCQNADTKNKSNCRPDTNDCQNVDCPSKTCVPIDNSLNIEQEKSNQTTFPFRIIAKMRAHATSNKLVKSRENHYHGNIMTTELNDLKCTKDGKCKSHSVVPVKANASEQNLNWSTLKKIIRDLIREEEENLINEFYRKQIGETNSNGKSITSRNPKSKSVVGSLGEQKSERETLKDIVLDKREHKTCLYRNDCDKGDCCIMGVCITTEFCYDDSIWKRESNKIIQVQDEQSKKCEDEKNCNENFASCNEGENCNEENSNFGTKNLQNENILQCRQKSDCHNSNMDCLKGVCVPMISLEHVGEFCLMDGTCKNKEKSCWMNVCV